jgi:hypothetical protein
MVEAALKFVAVPDPDGPVIYRQMSEMSQSRTGTAAIGAKRSFGQWLKSVPGRDGSAHSCPEASLTHLKCDDRTSRRPARGYSATELIREAANNELSTKSRPPGRFS